MGYVVDSTTLKAATTTPRPAATYEDARLLPAAISLSADIERTARLLPVSEERATAPAKAMSTTQVLDTGKREPERNYGTRTDKGTRTGKTGKAKTGKGKGKRNKGKLGKFKGNGGKTGKGKGKAGKFSGKMRKSQGKGKVKVDDLAAPTPRPGTE